MFTVENFLIKTPTEFVTKKVARTDLSLVNVLMQIFASFPLLGFGVQ